MNVRTRANMIGAAMAAVGLLAWGSSAHADLKCRQTLNKESAKLTQSIAKILQQCEQGVLDGKVTGPCPAGKSADKINGAKTKFTAAVTSKCATSIGEFPFGRCPNETGPSGTCGNILIQDKGDVGDCLACLADHNAKELVQKVLYTGPLPNADAAKCKKAVGSATVAFYGAKSKALAKCYDALLKGKLANTTCPDGKTGDAIAKAEAKKQATIAKSCCGDDGVCGGATCGAGPTVICQGGTNDLGPCTVDSECPGGVCVEASSGDACETHGQCGRCRNGTTGGSPCLSSGQCQSDNNFCDPTTLLCVGGYNPGDTCASTCVGGGNAGNPCGVASQCPGGSCPAPTLHCYGGVNNGLACTTAGVNTTECPFSNNCVGGPNNGATCTVNSQCPSGECRSSHQVEKPTRCVSGCPSIAGGSCQGTGSNLCSGSDDLRPVDDLGFPAPCPPLNTGGAPTGNVGQTGASLTSCVDAQADARAACQAAAGASVATALPGGCVAATTECSPSGTADVTVSIAFPVTCAGGANAGDACTTDGDCPGSTCTTTLGGVSISLGYNNVMIPGSGDVTPKCSGGSNSGATCTVNSQCPGGTCAVNVTLAQSAFSEVEEDGNDALVTSLLDLVGFTPGPLYTVHFKRCGALPTTADFGCVVRGASTTGGAEILDGVTCSVTSIL